MVCEAKRPNAVCKNTQDSIGLHRPRSRCRGVTVFDSSIKASYFKRAGRSIEWRLILGLDDKHITQTFTLPHVLFLVGTHAKEVLKCHLKAIEIADTI